MSKSCKKFRLSTTVKNISRFVDGEAYLTNTEEQFKIPWRMFIRKKGGYFDVGLICEKNILENRKWLIETDYTMKLVSHNGKNLTESEKFTFRDSDRYFVGLLISWEKLESDYVVDDSILVEAFVKIFKITDLPCDENEDTKTFLLSNTVKNISSIKEGDDYYTEIEKRYNIPWSLNIKRSNGFFGLYLSCEKVVGTNWVIKLDYDLRLKSLNGQSLILSDSESFVDTAKSGFDKFMRWDDMEERYMVNDSIIIEARVEITEMTGCDDESSSDDEDDFSSDDDDEEELRIPFRKLFE